MIRVKGYCGSINNHKIAYPSFNPFATKINITSRSKGMGSDAPAETRNP